MDYMFNGCSSLTNIDLSNFNTAKVTNMTFMFDGCSSLTSLDLTPLDTRKVTTMYAMFVKCSKLTVVRASYKPSGGRRNEPIHSILK